MKRFLKYALAAFAVLLLSGAVLVWIAVRSIEPLIDGVQLAQGNVIIVADDCQGPIQCASYLIRLQEGGFALVDAGLDPDAKSIRATLARIGYGDDAVRAILFTHGHGDHTAGARAFPNADIYIAERVQLTSGNPDRNGPDKPDTVHRNAVTRRLSDGEQLNLHGTTFKVFALPGHTADSAAFLVHGVLFLGDSAAAASDGSITAAPPMFSVDRERNQRELRALAARFRDHREDIHHMAFGHQGPLEGIDALLNWADAE